jgi:hypothetical protein
LDRSFFVLHEDADRFKSIVERDREDLGVSGAALDGFIQSANAFQSDRIFAQLRAISKDLANADSEMQRFEFPAPTGQPVSNAY